MKQATIFDWVYENSIGTIIKIAIKLMWYKIRIIWRENIKIVA